MDVAAEDLIDEPFSFVEEALLGDPADEQPACSISGRARIIGRAPATPAPGSEA